MRLWSLHPSYIDAKGLVALWREGLLARAILNDRTKGYKHHPQLERFKGCSTPIAAIDRYLWSVYEEAEKRGYHFDAGKLGPKVNCPKIPVTQGQLQYELEHLRTKLKSRDAGKYKEITAVIEPDPHPSFRIMPGDIEPWEKAE
jgi:hypothetical protein